MGRVERFFHIRPTTYGWVMSAFHEGNEVTPRGGATVRVIGDTDTDTVTFQVAYCSNNDQFCRATGRDVATKHPMTTTLRDSLPAVLQDVARNVTKRVLKLSRTKRQQHHLWNTDYSFATKHFKAKETV